MSVSCNLDVTCRERADLLAFLYVMFDCVFCHFPIQCPVSGVALASFLTLHNCNQIGPIFWKHIQYSKSMIQHVLLVYDS